MNKKNIYPSENFYLSIYLTYCDLSLLNITQNDNGRKSFNFSNSSQLQEKVEEFFNLDKRCKWSLCTWPTIESWTWNRNIISFESWSSTRAD